MPGRFYRVTIFSANVAECAKWEMGMTGPAKAVVLLSGGLDSTTCLAVAVAQGFETFALSFDYGQRHKTELHAAKRIASAFGVRRHLTMALDMTGIGGSALTAAIDVPKNRIDDAGETAPGAASIPATYVPARNTMFLSVALGWAEALGAVDIFIGVNALDYSGYPDCRPAFIRAFENLARVATAAGTEDGAEYHIHAPLMRLSKAQIIRFGTTLGVDYALTHSCYAPAENGAPCGRCDSCALRRKGFREAGIPDPLDAKFAR